jgi:hypothetical protein
MVSSPPSTVASKRRRSARRRSPWWTVWVTWVVVPVAAGAALWTLHPPESVGDGPHRAPAVEVPVGLLVPRR